MKAFISYSLTDQEQYIATLLSYRLREQGFTLIMSNNGDNIGATTKYQIFISELFVGLVTIDGPQWQRVLQEYELAIENNTPAILLIENGVPVHPSFSGNYVFFNRHNPQPAINDIKNRMTRNDTRIKQEGLGWLLGGAAILAAIALLSSNNNKR